MGINNRDRRQFITSVGKCESLSGTFKHFHYIVTYSFDINNLHYSFVYPTVHTFNNEEYKAGWGGSNAVDLCLGHAYFNSWPVHTDNPDLF
jgi:hypothetical protein